MPRLILSSKSPRRRELFSLLTADFMVVESVVDENEITLSAPDVYCQELAALKGKQAVKRFPNDIVIGCDTIVETDGRILGKPADAADAARMLNLLSGNTHFVYTGVFIHTPSAEMSFYCRTAVTFCLLTPEEIEHYIQTEDPFDKAGSYGIQGGAAKFIVSIDGDFYNVMGLPVSRLYRALRDLGAL